MRYFLLIWILLCLTVVSIAGFRGSTSRKPPIELFPDMDRQPKLRPEAPDSFFENGLSSQLQPAGTIAHTQPYKLGQQDVYPHEEHPFNTGRIAGSTNFVETNPLPVNQEVMARGQNRFQIFCSPCHSALADGNGVPRKIGAMAVVANLHDARIVRQPDGEIFNTITHGRNLMQSYASQVPVEDRWAIIAYLRALQLSWLGTLDDVPPEARGSLPGASEPKK